MKRFMMCHIYVSKYAQMNVNITCQKQTNNTNNKNKNDNGERRFREGRREVNEKGKLIKKETKCECVCTYSLK